MSNTTTTKLSEAEKQQIRYWIETVGCDLTACDSMNKDPSIEQWSNNICVDEINYEARLEQGLYDKGVAVICGQLRRGPCQGKYIGGLDFDNEEAFRKFCEIGKFDLMKLAQITRVEWHRDPGKINVFFITNRPFNNVAAGKGLEVMGVKIG